MAQVQRTALATSPSNNVANYFALDTNGVTGIIRRTTCHQGPDLSTATCVTDTVFEIDVAPKPSIAWVDSINSVTACAYETSRALAIVVDSDEVSPLPWTLTWTVTAENGTVSDIVQTITPAQIQANASLSCPLQMSSMPASREMQTKSPVSTSRFLP